MVKIWVIVRTEVATIFWIRDVPSGRSSRRRTWSQRYSTTLHNVSCKGVNKETPKSREEAFISMLCGRAVHLDEFCFRRNRIEKSHHDYARNSYCDEFINFLPRSYSRVPPWYYSRALPQFSHESNHRSYGFGLRENRFVPRRFGYGPRPHRGDRFPRKPCFPAGGFHTYFEPRHFNSPHFPHRGLRPTHSNSDVQKIVKTSSGRMIKCWIPESYLTNPSTEPSTFLRPM
jgi:hypothetical protein